MSDRAGTGRIRRVRGAILAILNMVYPAAERADHLHCSLLAIFPHLEWEHVRKDLSYLLEKGYLAQAALEDEPQMPWAKRCFRLTAAGVEAAERCIQDPAVEV